MVGEKHPGGKAPLEEVYSEAQNQQIDRQHAEELISKMRRSGDLIKPDKEHVKVV
jgi:replicative DNA helicase Mcm